MINITVMWVFSYFLETDTPSVWQDCETSNMSQAGSRRKKEIKKSGFRLRVGKSFMVKNKGTLLPFSPATIFLGLQKLFACEKIGSGQNFLSQNTSRNKEIDGKK